MSFFIAVTVAAYHQTELPSDEAGEKLFQSMQETMAGIPAMPISNIILIPGNRTIPDTLL